MLKASTNYHCFLFKVYVLYYLNESERRGFCDIIRGKQLYPYTLEIFSEADQQNSKKIIRFDLRPLCFMIADGYTKK